LGIPPDPRLIEVLGWLAYLIPVALYLYWPKSRRPGPRSAAWVKISIAAVIAATALGLAVGYPNQQTRIPAQATLVSTTQNGEQTVGTAQFIAGSDDNPATLQLTFAGSDPINL